MRASLGAQTVKNPPAMQENRFPSLGQEDPLEKGMATHPSILAWRVPWTARSVGLQSVGSQRAGMTKQVLHMVNLQCCISFGCTSVTIFQIIFHSRL